MANLPSNCNTSKLSISKGVSVLANDGWPVHRLNETYFLGHSSTNQDSETETPKRHPWISATLYPNIGSATCCRSLRARMATSTILTRSALLSYTAFSRSRPGYRRSFARHMVLVPSLSVLADVIKHPRNQTKPSKIGSFAASEAEAMPSKLQSSSCVNAEYLEVMKSVCSTCPAPFLILVQDSST